jgi:FlgD Ig-like domain
MVPGWLQNRVCFHQNREKTASHNRQRWNWQDDDTYKYPGEESRMDGTDKIILKARGFTLPMKHRHQSSRCAKGSVLSSGNASVRHSQKLFSFFVLVSLTGLAGLLFFSFPAWAESRLTITNVSLYPQFFDPEKGEATEIRYKLSQEAGVTLKIYDESDYLVKTVVYSTHRPQGDRKEYWNGTDQTGRLVPPGIYRFVIQAENKEGITTLSDLTDITGGQENQVASSEIDQKNGLITYVLKSPSLVITRLGLKDGGPMLRTLEFRKAKSGGLNQVPWDGLDNSGTVSFLNHTKLNLRAQAYSLSANNIVIIGPNRNSDTANTQMQMGREKRPNKKLPRKIIRNHWQHTPEKCRDPEIRIELPEGTQWDQDGTAIVNGLVRLKVDLPEQDRLILTEERFEVMFFVDFLFVYEEEAGYLPYNWTWNAQSTIKSPHYITVNLIGYEGHIGSATLKVRLN